MVKIIISYESNGWVSDAPSVQKQINATQKEIRATDCILESIAAIRQFLLLRHSDLDPAATLEITLRENGKSVAMSWEESMMPAQVKAAIAAVAKGLEQKTEFTMGLPAELREQALKELTAD